MKPLRARGPAPARTTANPAKCDRSRSSTSHDTKTRADRKNTAPRRAFAGASAIYASYSSDETASLLLLSLPVLAMILGVGMTQALKPHHAPDVAHLPAPASIAAARTPASLAPALTTLTLRAARPGTEIAAATPPPLAARPGASLAAQSAVAATAPVAPAATIRVANQSADIASATPAPAKADAGPLPPLAEPTAGAATLHTAPAQLAMLAPATPAPIEVTPDRQQPPALATHEENLRPPPALCKAPANLFANAKRATLGAPATGLTPAAFGLALASAAREQTHDLVIYNDKYRAISYPLGDVQPLYGVCTDVIIRAYRVLGIDLQQRVHEARIGGGDISIDHRRTETLRRFFARFGHTVPATTFAEDYRPGDIVTYNRPQNRHSRSHISIVSDVVAPSGRYMIVHNRGWGPQLEDGLFVDEITGHYRYDGGSDDGRELPASLPVATISTPIAQQVNHDVPIAEPTRSQTCRPGLNGLARATCIKRERVAARQDGKPVKGLGR